MMVGNISIMSVLYYGGTLVLQGDMTIGNLSSFILYTMSLASNYCCFRIIKFKLLFYRLVELLML